jgi:hypothetical protein
MILYVFDFFQILFNILHGVLISGMHATCPHLTLFYSVVQILFGESHEWRLRVPPHEPPRTQSGPGCWSVLTAQNLCLCSGRSAVLTTVTEESAALPRDAK